MKSENIVQWLEDKKLGVSMNKFVGEFKKFIVLKDKVNVYNGDRKIGKNTCRVWYGVKRIIEDETETEEQINKLNERIVPQVTTDNSKTRE